MYRRESQGRVGSGNVTLFAPPASQVREGHIGHQTDPRCPQTAPRQTQREPRQAQEPIYNGTGGVTPHGIYKCQEPPKSLPEHPKRRPNVALAATSCRSHPSRHWAQGSRIRAAKCDEQSVVSKFAASNYKGYPAKVNVTFVITMVTLRRLNYEG